VISNRWSTTCGTLPRVTEVVESKIGNLFALSVLRFLIGAVLYLCVSLVLSVPTVRDFYVERLTSSVAEIPANNYSPPKAGWAEIDHLADCIALSINAPTLVEIDYFVEVPFWNPAIYSSGGTTIGCPQLRDFLSSKGTASGLASSYSRYWHGYIAVLQPLVMIGGVRFAEVVMGALLLLSGLLLIWELERRSRGFGLLIICPLLLQPNLNLLFSMSHSISVTAALVFSVFVLRHKSESFNFMMGYGILYGSVIGFLSWLTYPALFIGLPIAVMCLSSKFRQLQIAIRSMVSACLIFVGWAGIWLLKIVLSRRFGPTSDYAMAQFNSWTKQPPYVETASYLASQLLEQLQSSGLLIILVLATLGVVNFRNSDLPKKLPGLAISALMSVCYWFLLNGHTAHSWSYTNLWGLTMFLVASVSVLFSTAIRRMFAVN